MRFISIDLIIDNTKLAGNELMVKFEKKNNQRLQSFEWAFNQTISENQTKFF